MIVCNMSQKVFKDCLDKNIIIRTVKGLFGRFCGQFKSRFGAVVWAAFVGIIYATICLEG